MENNNNQFEKIKSKFIIQKIFEYATNNYISKLIFVKYSKSLQKKLDLSLNDYQYLFLSNAYKYYNYTEVDFDKLKTDKNYLYNQAKNKLKLIGFSIEEAKKIIKNYEEKEKDKEKPETSKKNFLLHSIFPLHIFYPFIDVQIPYDKHYFISVPLYNIEKYNLENEYTFFSKIQI